MTPQQLVGLGVRLVAIWITSENVGFLLSMPATLRAMNQTEKIMNAYMIGGWWLAVAVVLWFFPMWIAHRIIPRTRFENKLNVQALDAARVGCSLLGLWLLIAQLQTFLWFLFVGALARENSSLLRSLTPDERLRFGVAIVQIVFALLLVFGSARFARVALREPGETNTETPSPGS